MSPRRRKAIRSTLAALQGFLSGLAGVLSFPGRIRHDLDNLTLERARIEQLRLKIQQEEAKIARENNAVLLQDLDIELKKLEIIKQQRALGVNESEIDPPFWNG